MDLSVSPYGMGGLGGHRYSAQLMVPPKTFPVAALVKCQYVLPSTVMIKGTGYRAGGQSWSAGSAAQVL